MAISKKKLGWGILGLGLVVAVVVSLALPSSQFTECHFNRFRLLNLDHALRDRASDLGGLYPRTLADLCPKPLSPERLTELRYRDGISGRTYDWLYFGESALGPAEGNAAIVVASPSAQICAKDLMHHRLVLTADRRVRILEEAEFQRRLAIQLQAHRGGLTRALERTPTAGDTGSVGDAHPPQ